ncbi:MAG: sigma-70 family RNA polymerase sigma factor [Candidatus Hydrogenedentes bacterium]|nr:sigma-70 family RNA polymerase sigma factor [Candidatus Hydrogenedentota bacterium]
MMFLPIQLSTDEWVVRRVLRGHRNDFSVLVRRYYPTVKSVIRSRLANPADAEDVAQEAFIQAFQKLDTLKAPQRFGPWLITIARSKAVSSQRKTWRETPLTDELLASLLAKPHSFEQEELRTMLKHFLNELDPESRELLMMHYYGGKGLRECAQLLNISKEAAAKRLQRTRNDLGARLLSAIGEAPQERVSRRAKVTSVMGAIALCSTPWSQLSAAGMAVSTGGMTVVTKMIIGISIVGATVLGGAAYSNFQTENDHAPTITISRAMSSIEKADVKSNDSTVVESNSFAPPTNIKAAQVQTIGISDSRTVPAAVEAETIERQANASNPARASDETLRKWIRIDAKECIQSRDRIGLPDVYLIAEEKDRLRVWQEAAKRDMPEGQVLLALCHSYGIGVEKNDARSAELLESAIEQEYAPAKFYYAEALFLGLGTAQDKVAALEYFKEAAIAGDRAAMWELGALYGNGNSVPADPSASSNWLKRSASAGAPYAMFQLGQCYFSGNLLPKDESEGRQWIARAADMGCPFGVERLRELSGHGAYMLPPNFIAPTTLEARSTGPVTDYAAMDSGEHAREVASLSDEELREQVQKDESAMRAVRDRVGYSKPYLQLHAAKQLPYWQEAANRGIAEGQFLLGMCHTTSIGVERDDIKRQELYRAAAEQGDPTAMHALAVDLVPDQHERVNWFRKSAEAGDTAGMHRLANCYKHGLGVEQSNDEALSWYLKAAEAGNAEAKYQLGEAFLSGTSFTPQDEKEGRRWLAKAANGGFPKAILALRRIAPMPEGREGLTDRGISHGPVNAQP